MACLTFIQIQRKGSVHPIRVSRAFLKAVCVCAGGWGSVLVERTRTSGLVEMVAIGTGKG